MTKEQISQYVKDWMKTYEPDTFAVDEHGRYMYTCGHSGINLPVFFEELLEDYSITFAQSNEEKLTNGDLSPDMIEIQKLRNEMSKYREALEKAYLMLHNFNLGSAKEVIIEALKPKE